MTRLTLLLAASAAVVAGCEPPPADGVPAAPPAPASPMSAPSAGPLAVGEAVPDLPFADLPGAGEPPISLHELRGETVVVEFWATWCPSCRRAIPHLNALADGLNDEPVRFLAVTLDDAGTAAAFLADTPVTARVGPDPGGTWHARSGSIRSRRPC